MATPQREVVRASPPPLTPPQATAPDPRREAREGARTSGRRWAALRKPGDTGEVPRHPRRRLTYESRN